MTKQAVKHLLSINDLSKKEVEEIFSLSTKLKKRPFGRNLANKTIALVFEKPSTRTRVSFETGVYQLGGHIVVLNNESVRIGSRESLSDFSKTLSRYVDCIIVRTFEHQNLIEIKDNSSVPVINALSDYSHPCQALADIFTIKEKKKNLKNLKIVFVGDGNNVARSLNELCLILGIEFVLSCPIGYELENSKIVYDPFEAVKDADVIYTDVWTSMGQEKEAKKRKKIFKNYQVNSKLLSFSKKDVLIMHCLPAHRGEEITDDVIDSKNSIVFDQAENRLHVQKALLLKLLN